MTYYARNYWRYMPILNEPRIFGGIYNDQARVKVFSFVIRISRPFYHLTFSNDDNYFPGRKHYLFVDFPVFVVAAARQTSSSQDGCGTRQHTTWPGTLCNLTGYADNRLTGIWKHAGHILQQQLYIHK